jgi:hypothetical protein
MHRCLKNALRACAASANWFYHLPWTLQGLCATTRDYSTPSPAELLYGAQLVLPGQFVVAANPPLSESFFQRLCSLVDSTAPAPTRHNSASTASSSAVVSPILLHACHVFVHRDAAKPPLAHAYDGPYEVLEHSPHTFRLQMGD